MKTLTTLKTLTLFVALSASFTAEASGAGKLGPVIAVNVSSRSTGADALLANCPAVAKWMIQADIFPPNIDGFASRCPQSVIVLQPTFDTLMPRTLDEDPVQSAEIVWATMTFFQTLLTTPAERLWLEGPTANFLPDWENTAAPAWLSVFWKTLVRRVQATGASLLVGLDGVKPGVALTGLIDTLEAQNIHYGFARSAFTPTLCIGETNEALAFEALLPSLPATRSLFLTRAGHDRPVSVEPADYTQWLTWFDVRLRNTPKVVGATLYDFGSGRDSAHDILDGALADLISIAVPLEPSALVQCDSDSEDEDPEPPDAGSSTVLPGSGTFRDADESGCNIVAGKAFPILGILALGLLRKKLKII